LGRPACGTFNLILGYILKKTAILKFDEKERLKKFRGKIFFSGISEATPSNFSLALIFWSFLIKSLIPVYRGKKDINKEVEASVNYRFLIPDKSGDSK